LSPRGYTLGQRRLAADLTRRRIVAAARDVLAAANPADFTVEAVAKQAGVARMTVYHQFASKRGVLEALFDDLANRGLMPTLGPVFHEPDPARALDGVIDAFTAFWNSDRIVLRRARALAALDPEVAQSVRARDELRRGHLRRILDRLYAQTKPAPTRSLTSSVDVLHMLTSFETFDALVTDGRTVDETAAIVRQLAAIVLQSSS
jgi:AcrR family transcriptional regulator